MKYMEYICEVLNIYAKIGIYMQSKEYIWKILSSMYEKYYELIGSNCKCRYCR